MLKGSCLISGFGVSVGGSSIGGELGGTTRRFASRTVLLQPTVMVGDAALAALFQLTVRAGVALRALVFQLAVRAGVAHHAVLFQLAVRVLLAVCAVGF